MRLKFDVQASLRNLRANLEGRGSEAQKAIQALNRRRGPQHYERVREATPVDTGFMREALRFELTPREMGYRVGWAASDFEAAGHAPYFLYNLYGTRHQSGDDFFSPIADDEEREYRREAAEILRETVARGRKARATGRAG